MKIPLTALCVLASVALAAVRPAAPTLEHLQDTTNDRKDDMQLGNFSVSLTVKDLAASQAFYEKLGFEVFGGDAAQNWLILQNGTTTIGLFQGMFEQNILTFNPGWNHKAEKLDEYMDVREIQRRLRAAGIEPTTEADESTSGPASMVLTDPDGNPILIDQHV